MWNKDLWKERWDLLQKHLKSFVFDAHNRCIPKAQQPITYIECPLQNDKSYVPLIRLDALTPDNDVWCTKENPKRLVSRSAYNLLLNPDNQLGK